MTDELSLLDATAQAELVRTGQVTAVELVAAAIKRVEDLNPALNAVITPVFDQAVDAADAAASGPFTGVPYLLKDLACEMEGVRFTEGSRFLAGHVSAFDSELVLRLRRAGLVILGKTNTPEFGMAPACEPELFGPTRNPWDTQRSTSGSSGGSAAAVASGMVPFTHGNDLGGSLRYPASACGLFASSRPGRATRSGPNTGTSPAAQRSSMRLPVRSGTAPRCSTRHPVPRSATRTGRRPPPGPSRPRSAPTLGRLRIAYTARTPDGDLGHPDCVAAVENAARLCASLGHEVTEARWPGITPEFGTNIGVMIHAATSWILRYWIRRIGREPGPSEIEPLTRALWQAGEQVTAAEWLLAVEDIQRFARAVARFFTIVDVFLTPTMSAPPLPIGTIYSTPEDPWRSLSISGQTVRYAWVVANVTGNPAMSVPLWWNDDGLPIGAHFLGRFGDEATLIRLASQLEAAQPWAGRLPAGHAAHHAAQHRQAVSTPEVSALDL
ncbi:MAG TPA: amidase [Streptosporangiaceae bacterium]|nr:amidase [Streptosporangiaceae bacterium]